MLLCRKGGGGGGGSILSSQGSEEASHLLKQDMPGHWHVVVGGRGGGGGQRRGHKEVRGVLLWNCWNPPTQEVGVQYGHHGADQVTDIVGPGITSSHPV